MIPQHDFLALTRRHEWQLDPFDFDLPDGTRGSVWDTGVICLEPQSALPGPTAPAAVPQSPEGPPVADILTPEKRGSRRNSR